MIYSRFGSKLTLISRAQDKDGQPCVQATCEGTEGVRTYRRNEMTADDGNPEIDAAIAKLPPAKTVIAPQPAKLVGGIVPQSFK